ncbi:MAG: response regulator [Oligoflexales bacterium]|nr:response regulator [Oligoflexales bacterium]
MKKILLVEDSDRQRSKLGNFLSQDWCVLSAQNGKEALELYEKNQDVEAIITDLNMPIMGGIEFIKAVHQQAGGSSIPAIFAISSFFDDSSMEELKNLGVHLKFVKPIIPERLNKVLKMAISNMHRPTGQRTNVQLVEKKAKTILFVDDSPEILNEITEYFSQKPEYEAICVHNPAEAVNLFQNHHEISYIFCDIEMPQMSGLTFARKIRSIPSGKKILKTLNSFLKISSSKKS